MIEQRKNLVSGIITSIEKIHEELSIITLQTPAEKFRNTRRNFYGTIDESYIGKCVDFETLVNQETDTLVQKINGADFYKSIEIPKSQAKTTIRKYRKKYHIR
jgi:hypothetical protein